MSVSNTLCLKKFILLSERERAFMFARRPSVCLSICRLSVCNVRAPYSDD